jgi:hypothetical protein
MMDSTNSSEERTTRTTRGWRVGDHGVRGCAAVLLAALVLTLPRQGFAQGKVITISEVTIVGRVQKPIAAVDVSRIQPKMTLAELRQPFLDRIEKAVYRAPF